jgi:hypothetical protein
MRRVLMDKNMRNSQKNVHEKGSNGQNHEEHTEKCPLKRFFRSVIEKEAVESSK